MLCAPLQLTLTLGTQLMPSCVQHSSRSLCSGTCSVDGLSQNFCQSVCRWSSCSSSGARYIRTAGWPPTGLAMSGRLRFCQWNSGTHSPADVTEGTEHAARQISRCGAILKPEEHPQHLNFEGRPSFSDFILRKPVLTGIDGTTACLHNV